MTSDSPLDFLRLARERRSIRAYEPRPVEEEKLEAVLEAGRLAPSACNLQPWGFVVIRDPEARRRLEAVYDKAWFYEQAPVVVAVCCQRDAAWVRRRDGKHHGDVDCAIAVDHMALCAQALGLGTCWVCAFDPAAAREVLALPAQVEPVAFFPLGYPAETGRPKDRKPLAEIVHHGTWGARRA